MTSVLCSPRTGVLAVALFTLTALAGAPRHAAAQGADRMVNTGTVNIKYKPSGSGTWLVLTPGQGTDVTAELDILNENFQTGQVTAQRNVSSAYSTAYTNRLDPGSQGTIASGGVVCTVGRFVVTTYAYFGQYAGNLYGRAFLTRLASPAMSPGAGEAQTATNPVVTAWGFQSYAGTSSRLEITVLNNSETGGVVTLVGSSDPTCSTQTYTIGVQGDYINWNDQGIVSARSMGCSNKLSFPSLSPLLGALLLLGLAGVAAAAAYRAREASAAR